MKVSNWKGIETWQSNSYKIFKWISCENADGWMPLIALLLRFLSTDKKALSLKCDHDQIEYQSIFIWKENSDLK